MVVSRGVNEGRGKQFLIGHMEGMVYLCEIVVMVMTYILLRYKT